MTTLLAQNLDAAGYSVAVTLQPGESLEYASAGTFTGFLVFQRSRTQGATFETVEAGVEDTDVVGGTVKNETTNEERYRFALYNTDGETPVSGDTDVSMTLLGTDAPNGDFTDVSATGTVAAALFAIGDTQILSGSGVPVDYTDGTPPATGEGTAGIGSLYLRNGVGEAYINIGTKAEPAWSRLAFASELV